MNQSLPGPLQEQLQEQLRVLPEYLGAHVSMVALALVLGTSLSLPLSLLVARSSTGSGLMLSFASVVQTVPSLALLALMVPLLGAFGFWPAMCALVLYSMLPIVRNTVTAVTTLDKGVLEAARGVGMTPLQTLRLVELPLALPVIIAGVRTAAVWVVGIATLSTPVGQPSLGNFIFAGLQTRNWTSVLVGCISAALLALALDGLLALLERGLRQRRRAVSAWASLGLLVLVGLGSSAPRWATGQQRSAKTGNAVQPLPSSAPADSNRTSPPDEAATMAGSRNAPAQPSRPLRIGAKTFTEQYVLARLIERRLARAGLASERVESLGSSVVFDALCRNQIDVYVDYTGTIYANTMKRNGAGPAWQVSAETAAWLATERGVRQLGALGFENAYALAMRRNHAAELHLRSIEDLSAASPALRLGSDYEFFDRPEWRRLRGAYGLRFAQQVSYDSSFMYAAVRDGAVDVITAFSSDGRIAAYDLVVLSDPLQAFPPYDAVLLLAPGVANDARVVAALQPLIGAIDVEHMRQANWRVDRADDKRTVADAARWLDEQIAQ